MKSTYNSSVNSPALSAAIEQLSKLHISGLLITYSASGEWVWANALMTDGSSRYVEYITESSMEETKETGGRSKAKIRRKSRRD